MKFLLRCALGLLGFSIAAGIGEVVLRGLCRDRLRLAGDERYYLFRYDSELGWFPTENLHGSFEATRKIEVLQNTLGFRDVEFGAKTRPRLLCIGDSFVWGYDVQAEERFTDVLRDRLPGWDILNLGVSGYGTDQELLLLRKFAPQLQPDAVLLVFSDDGDPVDNSSNVRYEGYYKPYFVATGTNLQLKGVPVPFSRNYFQARTRGRWWWQSYVVRLGIRGCFRIFLNPPVLKIPDPSRPLITAMQGECRARPARFYVGLIEGTPEMTAFCARQGIPCVDLGGAERYPKNGKHWTPAGHARVAEKIAGLLRADGSAP